METSLAHIFRFIVTVEIGPAMPAYLELGLLEFTDPGIVSEVALLVR